MKKRIAMLVAVLLAALTALGFGACNIANIIPVYKTLASEHEKILLSKSTENTSYTLNFDNLNLSEGVLRINLNAPKENLAATVDLSEGFKNSAVDISRISNVIRIKGQMNTYYATDFIEVNVYVPIDKITCNGNMSIVANLNDTNISVLEISAAGATEFNGVNMNVDTLTVKTSGASKLKLNVNGITAELEMSGATECSLQGSLKTLGINASGASLIQAKTCLADTVNIVGKGTVSAELNVKKYLDATLSGACRVNYSGQAVVTKSLSGLSSVIKDS